MIRTILLYVMVLLVIAVFALLVTIVVLSARQKSTLKAKKILKYVGLAFVMSVVGYIFAIAFPLLKDFSKQNLYGKLADKDYLLIVLTIIGVVVAAVVFVLTPVFIVRMLLSRGGRSRKDAEAAEKLQRETNEVKNREMDIWKKQHRRVRCPYCGTYNYASDKRCNSCGAVVAPE